MKMMDDVLCVHYLNDVYHDDQNRKDYEVMMEDFDVVLYVIIFVHDLEVILMMLMIMRKNFVVLEIIVDYHYRYSL